MNQDAPYGFVYETLNTQNGMKYIGKCIYSRQNNCDSYLGSGLYLKRAIKKYGRDAFTRRTLEDAYSAEELNKLEESYIQRFDAVASSEYYNVKLTSIGGDTFTTNPNREHTRNLKRENMTGERNHQFGKAKTEAMIASVKQANNRAVQIEGVLYSSQTEASKKLGLNNSTLSYRLDTDSWSDWTRVVPKNKVIKKNANPTCTVEIDGVTYTSIKDAAKALGTSTSTVIRRLDNDAFPTYKRLSERIR